MTQKVTKFKSRWGDEPIVSVPHFALDLKIFNEILLDILSRRA